MQVEKNGAKEKNKKSLSLSSTVFLGLILGVACGIFFGEYCAGLRIVGKVFIALLQMTVLPYIICALVLNIGGLTLKQARHLAGKAGLVLLGLYGAVIILVLWMPLGLPALETASFFSTSLLKAPEQIDYLGLYIPANPFKALANTLIPAVVLFSIAVGLALISVKGKERLLEPLSAMVDSLVRINMFIVKLTPIGVFAMAASAAGTLTIEELGRLQAYLILYIGAALLLTLWILPMLAAAFTPFEYRHILAVSKDAVVIALATDSVFIILPMLSQGIKELFEKYRIEHSEIRSSVDVSLPIAFTFPQLGKLLTLVFIPFAAWFTGSLLSSKQYLSLIVSGLPSLFGKVSLALPFLLDMFRLPSDMFQIFLLAGIICSRFSSFLSAMALFVFTALTVCLITGVSSVRGRRLIGGLVITAVFMGGMVAGTRFFLGKTMKDTYTKNKVLAGMQLLKKPVPSIILNQSAPNPVKLREDQSVLDRIFERGVIRMGFHPDALPFGYINDQGDLVGLDIELAHELAKQLGVKIEFVPVEIESLSQQLEEDHIDIVMAGLPVVLSGRTNILYSDAYIDLTPAIAVPDYRRHDFSDMDRIKSMESLKLYILDVEYLKDRIRTALPKAHLVAIDSPRDFFEGSRQHVDALLIAAERGSAWTLLYPQYTVLIPWTEDIRWPAAYPIGGQDMALASLVNRWIELIKKDGTLKEAYDYWILGKNTEPRQPRWNIMRDVLHWVE